jgi:hypothetical protein
MGGYATIPLAGVAPQIQTPIQVQTGMQNLRNMQMQNAIGAQQAQSMQMDNYMKQMELQQMQLFMRALQAPADSDADTASGSKGAPANAAQPAGDDASVTAAAPQTAAAAPATPPLSGTLGGFQIAPTSSTVPMSALSGPLGNMSIAPGPGVPPAASGATPASAMPDAGGSAQPPIPSAAQTNPGTLAPGTQNRAPQQRDFSDVGNVMSGALNRFLKMPGANPMFASKIYGGIIDMQQKMLEFSKTQREDAMARADIDAGKLEAIINSPAAERAGNWQQFLGDRLASGRITQQQYQQGMQNVPTDSQLTFMRDSMLADKQQVEMAEKRAMAVQANARTDEFKSQASARDLPIHAQASLATLPNDPAQFDDWKAKQTPDVQHILENVQDPWTAKQVLPRAVVPFTEQQKLQQEQESQLINEGVAASRQGSAAYGQFLGRIQVTNPTLYARMPPLNGFNAQTYPVAINDLGLNPAQRQTANYENSELGLRQKELGFQGARLQLERQRLNMELSNIGVGALAKGQGNNLIAKYKSIENDVSGERDRLGRAIVTGDGYVDDRGNYRAWDSLYVSPEAKDGMIADMKIRYGALTGEHLQTIADKNAVYQRMGATPQVTTEQAQADILKDARTVMGPNWHTPATPTSTSPAAPAARPTAPPAAQRPAPPTAQGGTSWKVGNQTFTKGQTVYSNGKAYTIRGFNPRTGRLIADPQ